MLDFDRAEIEEILNQLECIGFGDSQAQYKFHKENDNLCLLGAGASSFVYEMYDVANPDRHYAVKVLGFGDKQLDPDFVKYTVQLQYDLSEQSDNILRVIDLWTMKVILDENKAVKRVIGIDEEDFDDIEGIILQLVFMEKLDGIISKDKYGNVCLLRDDLNSEDGVIDFAKQIGRAIFTVHNNSILHRDIKLENIFWDKKLELYKLGDFGVARYVDDGNAETVLFTDGYGAPEIEKRLQDYYNASADIYSFGITLYLLLNNLRFPGSDTYHSIVAQYEKDFVVPAPEHASEKMAKIIRKMCSYRAQDRYQSVEEVLMEIGRIDGSYTENGFLEEYDDLETEAYSDDGSGESSTKNTEDDNSQYLWEKDDDDLTREERLKKKRILQKDYAWTSVWKCFFSALLFICLFESITIDTSFVSTWQFWLLSIAVLIEAVLQRVKEFHIGFGAVVIALSIYSMASSGVNIPQIVILLVVLLGLPAITGGCALGTVLWTVHVMTGKLTWLDFFASHDIGWVVLVLLIGVIESFILNRMDNNKTAALGEKVWVYMIDKIWIVFIIAGIILMILEKTGVMEIPVVIDRLHLIRSGICVFVIEIMYLWYYGMLTKEEN